MLTSFKMHTDHPSAHVWFQIWKRGFDQAREQVRRKPVQALSPRQDHYQVEEQVEMQIKVEIALQVKSQLREDIRGEMDAD